MKMEKLPVEAKIVQTRFSLEFQKDWSAFLIACEPELSSAHQLHIGNHMRPQLACWGYMLGKDADAIESYADISKLAVCIEAVHKASVIIDDIIDGDTKRRGQPCMHTVYGEYPTIFFAVCMLAKAILQLRDVFPSTEVPVHAQMIGILCNTIHTMCIGAIREINASAENQIDFDYISSIIDSETAQLIKNSLYMGYLLSGNNQQKVEDAICSIGMKCGYLFQVMNDLEPFCNPNYIQNYKGNLNADFLHARKSIVLPYLYRECAPDDQKMLIDALNRPEMFPSIKRLFDSYGIQEIVTGEVEDIYASILQLLSRIADAGHASWAEMFTAFTNELRTRYQAILSPEDKRGKNALV